MAVRKSNIQTTNAEWIIFKNIVNQLIQNGTYDDFVNWHGTDDSTMAPHRMHGTERFLPWHRAYLLKFERELKKVNPNAFIPYWDWGNDKGAMKGFNGFKGKAIRKSGTKQKFQQILNNGKADNLMQITEFGDFSQKLERGYHDNIHTWFELPSSMRTARSPLDPGFWLHHAQVDRLWHKWQEKHKGKPSISPGSNDYKLDPWANEFNIGNINDISKLGVDSYSYI